MSGDPERQKRHYETIHDDYESHYYDATSMRYRDEVVYDWLFGGESFAGQRVADVACGNGATSLALRRRFPSADTIGFDISPPACEAYRAATGAPAHQVDLTSALPPDVGAFDAAMVIGGIHHCVYDLPAAFANLARLVKPGGKLLMMEPNSRFLLQGVRDWWYRKDRYFDHQTEEALSHQAIADMAGASFGVDRVRYFGGPAFYLILNSLVTRVPLRWKPGLAPLLMPIEHGWNKLPGERTFPAFMAVWTRKRPDQA